MSRSKALPLLCFLALCLSEVSYGGTRCRLFFQGLLGHRYTENPIANSFLRENKLSANSLVYRAMPRRYLIESKGEYRIAGVPRDVALALVRDIYHDNKRMSVERLDHPVLNVTDRPSRQYEPGIGEVLVAIRVGDILEAGGLPYPDVSSLGAIPAFVFTLPSEATVPVQVIQR
jgi:hypothetical protein